MRELIEKRKPREKHFLKGNGEFVAMVYDEDIHFLRNGKYEEIDNTIIENEESYTNKNNVYKVHFGKKPKKSLMKLELLNHYIDIKLNVNDKFSIGKRNDKSKFLGGIDYYDIFDNIDLDYKVLSNKVKESIILKSREVDIDKLEFDVETDLELIINQDRSISAIKDNKIIFIIEAPYMIDSNGFINNNVSYSIQRKEDNYLLKLILDEVWLKAESTKYPVMIDPTITNSGLNNSVYDTYIYPNDTNATRYNSEILKVGVDKNNVINRALLKFDLPTIGTGSQIIEASLNLRGYPDTTKTHQTEIINVHRITENWNENTANWNTMNSKYDSRVEGIVQSTRGYNNKDGVILPYVTSADITGLVKKWYSSLPNYGLMLKCNKEINVNNEIPTFFSKDYSSNGTSPKPILAITYRNQNGLENYMSYQSHSFVQGVLYNNYYNGNLIASFNIGNTLNGSFPADLKLIYNTNDVILGYDKGYGLGIRLNFNQTIQEVTIDEFNYLKYNDKDGTEHYFINKKTEYDSSNNTYITTDYDNTYFDEDGLDLMITNNTNEYILSDKDGGIMKFTKDDGIGYLTEIIDNAGSKISVIYDENYKITKIVDADSNEITISYNENSITVVSFDQTVTLSYFSNQLISITGLAGTTLFTYNDKKIIDSVTDINGKKVIFEYYDQSPYRVKKISEYGYNNTLGNYIELSYGQDCTVIKDSEERITTMVFSSNGTVVSVSNMETKNNLKTAYGTKIKYGETFMGDTKNNNKLLVDELPFNYVKNYIDDSSFERENTNFIGTNEVVLSTTEEQAFSGFKSMKAINSTENQLLYKNIVVPKDSYYTFSAYIKNTNNVRISLSYINSDSEIIENISECIFANDEFERYDITLNYPQEANSDLMIKIYLDTIGTVYIDDIQLEEGEVANNYNMLENSDFSKGLTGWDLSVREGTVIIPTSDVFEVVTLDGGVNALKIKMDPAYTINVSQDFNVKGKVGDKFNISFWYKNLGFTGSELMGPISYNNVFMRFNFTEEMATDAVYTKALYRNDDEWQYFSHTFEAYADFESFTLKFLQALNANELYITNLSLMRDIRTMTYEYDNKGNIISTIDLDDKISEFKYDSNNQLVKLLDPRGKNFTYEYDNIVTDKIIRAVSGTGISNEVIDDEFDNPITDIIINRRMYDKIDDAAYIIRLKGTEKYLKMISGQVSIGIDKYCHNRWYFEKNQIDGEDYFKISNSIILNKYISVENDSIKIVDNTNCLFALIQNNNGSYLIKNKETGKYLKNENDLLILADYEKDNFNYEFYIELVDNDKFMENDIEYTEDGKYVVSTTDTNLNKSFYDIDHDTGLLKSTTNAKGQTISYDYDSKKRITKVIDGEKIVNYIYNDKEVLSQIVHDSREYKFIYDEFLNVKSINVGDNISLITNEYGDNNGKIKSLTYGNNDRISYEYDEFDRIKTLTTMNNIYNYRYGCNGDLLKVISNDSEMKYTYDLAKKVYEYKCDGFLIRYGYDSSGEIISKVNRLNNQNYNVEYTLNDDDAIIKTSFDSDKIDYAYDKLGRITTKTLNDRYNTNYIYKSNGKRTTLLVERIRNNGDEYSYRYDKLNNITHIYHNGNLENKYYYDYYNELIMEDNYISNKTIRYKYDNYGNIITKKEYQLGSYNQLLENNYSYNNSNWCDQLTKFNNDIIIYDNAGNPIKIGDNINLSWINGRHLDNYNDGNYNIKYKYNVNNIRTSKIVNGIETKYYVEGSSIILEKIGNNVIYYLRNDIDDLIGFRYDSNTYYYLKNNQNDIIGIIDKDYNVVAKYTYDAWGNILSILDSEGNDISSDDSHIANINPYRYRSYYYDKETKLYYLITRYYNPMWGRFISCDSVICSNQDVLSYNLYAYCSNNPVNFVDNGGRGFKSFISKAKKWVKKSAKKAIKVLTNVATSIVKSSNKKVSKKSSSAGTKKKVVNNVVSAISSSASYQTTGTIVTRSSGGSNIIGGIETFTTNKSGTTVVGTGKSPIVISHDISNTGVSKNFSVNTPYTQTTYSKTSNGVKYSGGLKDKDSYNGISFGVDGLMLFAEINNEYLYDDNNSVGAYTRFSLNVLVPVIVVVGYPYVLTAGATLCAKAASAISAIKAIGSVGSGLVNAIA